VWALFEIETEGVIPWAAVFPCLRYKGSPEAKEITSYHLLMGGIMFALLEISSVVIRGGWISLTELLQLAAWLLLATNLEDFLWNIMNPSELYGWQKTFVEERYPAAGGKSIRHIPIDYFGMVGGSGFLALISGVNMNAWLLALSAFIFVAIASILIMPRVHTRFPRWGEMKREYNRQHIFFFGNNVTAEVNVVFSDGREGYTVEVPGVSTFGRINFKNSEELMMVYEETKK